MANLEIKNVSRTTPDCQPPPVQEDPDHLITTPKKPEEVRALVSLIEPRATPRTRRSVREIANYVIQMQERNQLLREELQEIRKHMLEEEVVESSKRLRKEVVQCSWDLEQVSAAREGRRPSRVRITQRSDDSFRICVLSERLDEVVSAASMTS